MTRRKLFLLAALMAGVLSVWALLFSGHATSPAQASSAGIDWANLPVQQQPNDGPLVTTAVHYDLSPPLRDMARNAKPYVPPSDPVEVPEGEGIAIEPKSSGFSGDGAAQTILGPLAIPTPIISFDGVSNMCNCSPPDSEGDVGPNHYVQMVNLHYQIYNKSGVSLLGPFPNNTLWAGFGGPCQTENAGDPIVLHDQLADRWVLTQFSDSTGPFFNCVAVSQTADPTGAYHRYAFSAPSFPDYPKYGVWPDAYYLNTRENVIGNYALERAEMLVGNPAARSVRFQISQGGSGPNGLLPSDLDGSMLPPAGAPNYFIGTTDTDAGAAQDAVTIYKFHVDWVNTANSTFTGPTILPAAPFDSFLGTTTCTTSRQCVPQPGTANRIDHLGYRQRPTWRAAYRNFGTHESIVTNQSVEGAPLMSGIRWYELRDPNGTAVIHQQGTYVPGATDGIHRWMGSIAMDAQGNMALGYSASSDTLFPSVRYTGRLVTDPLGEMPQGEGSIHEGTGSQTTSPRWGDYSSMRIDPVDDCTFWYTTEYIPVTSGNGWRNRIGSFKYPGCVSGGGSPTPTTTGTPPTVTTTRTATAVPPTTTRTQTPCPAGGYTTTTGTATFISGTLDIGNNCDDCTTTITLPFPVSVYGTNYNSAVVESNGTLQFTGDNTEFVTGCNPLPRSGYGRTIFPYYDDLRTDTDAADGIYTAVVGTAPNRQFVIEWRTTYFGRAGRAHFAVILSESSTTITVQYGPTADNGSLETSGIQSAGTGPFTQFSCGTATLTNGLRVDYVSSGGGGCPTITPPTVTSTRTATSVTTPCPGGGTPTPIVVNGSLAAGDPTQTLRLFRDGIPDTCLVPGGPCSTTGSGSYQYDAYTYTNSGASQVCVVVDVSTTCTGTNFIFVGAYVGAFNPANICANWVADVGSSPNPTGTFSFNVPAGAQFTLVVSEVTNNAGCPAYTLTITGLGGGGGVCPTPPTTTSTVAPPTVTRTSTRTSTVGATISPSITRTATSTPCTISFTDVQPGDPFYAEIRCLACRGIVSGYADGTFRPNNPVTRGQIAKMVSNSAGYSDPVPATQQTYQDVPPTDTFWIWIERLTSRGHMSGYPCGSPEPCVPPLNRPYFRPYNDATRGQVSKIVSNAAGFSDPIPATQQTFEDVPPTSTFWVWIERLAMRGVITGVPCGGVNPETGQAEPCVAPGNRPYFRPNNRVTRGQSAQIVARSFFPGCVTP